MKKLQLWHKVVGGLSFLFVVLLLLEILFTTETVRMKRGPVVIYEDRSVRLPWNQQSWKRICDDAELRGANDVRLDQRGFFGILWCQQFFVTGTLTTGDGQEQVRIQVP
jgi:hypothetical protein